MIAFDCKREERKMDAKLRDSTDGCAPFFFFFEISYFSDFFVAAKHCYHRRCRNLAAKYHQREARIIDKKERFFFSGFLLELTKHF